MFLIASNTLPVEAANASTNSSVFFLLFWNGWFCVFPSRRSVKLKRFHNLIESSLLNLFLFLLQHFVGTYLCPVSLLCAKSFRVSKRKHNWSTTPRKQKLLLELLNPATGSYKVKLYVCCWCEMQMCLCDVGITQESVAYFRCCWEPELNWTFQIVNCDFFPWLLRLLSCAGLSLNLQNFVIIGNVKKI